MLLENDIIKLRALEPEDLEVLYRMENASRFWIYGNTLTPYSRNTLRRYINEAQQTDIYESKQLKLIIVLKQTDTSIGILDLYDFDIRNSRAGLGILIDENYRNKGYAQYALSIIEKYAFDFLRLHQLFAHIAMSNLPSLKLFENAGYKEVGILKDWIHRRVEFEDVKIVQLIHSIG